MWFFTHKKQQNRYSLHKIATQIIMVMLQNDKTATSCSLTQCVMFCNEKALQNNGKNEITCNQYNKQQTIGEKLPIQNATLLHITPLKGKKHELR